MPELSKSRRKEGGCNNGYQSICDAWPPTDLLPEAFEPILHRAKADGHAYLVLDNGKKIANKVTPEKDRFFLFKEEQPREAYKLNGRPSMSLDHHCEGWGTVFFAFVLPRIGLNKEDAYAFKAPHPEEVEQVVIKRLNKSVIKDYLAHGGHENPYKEIKMLQQLGDGRHVLPIKEALEDDDYIYIVTPFCSEGSLLEAIPFREGLPEDLAMKLFRNILEILKYLYLHGICHHDISPDNFFFYNCRLVLSGFGLSIKIPRKESDGWYLIKPQGRFGTFACQAPELFRNKSPFDGAGVDLWSAVVVLYLMLTGFPLYQLPDASDIGYLYFVLADGLQPCLNEQMVEVMESVCKTGNEQSHKLMTRVMANLNISQGAYEVLRNVLVCQPADRWTLLGVLGSEWVQNGVSGNVET